MRNAKNIFAVLLITTTVLFTNCSPDHDYNSIATTEQVLTLSQWSVDHYQNQSQTMPLGNYRLFFNSSGTLNVKKGNEIIAGSWTSSFNANNQEIISITLNSADASLMELNKNWKVLSLQSSSVLFEENNTGIACQLRIKKEY